MSYPRFEYYGVDHVTAIAATVLMCVAAVWAGQRYPRSVDIIRKVMGFMLLSIVVAWPIEEISRGKLWIWAILPLDLCTFTLFVSIYALFTRSQRAFECMYFWSLTATALALFSPSLKYGYPDPRFVIYFALHGFLVMAAVFMTWGVGMRPRPGAAWRVFLYTNAFAAVVGVVDVLFDKNYFFLRKKPAFPTLLDHFGPWPYYLLVCEVIMLVLFAAFQLPFGLTSKGRRRLETARAEEAA